MLPKKHRLSDHKTINLLKKNGKLVQGSHFGLLFIREEARTISKVAFIVSRKVAKTATDRNKVKRQLREAVRELLPNLKPGYCVLILAKKPAASASPKQLKLSTKDVFREVGILETDV